MTHATLFHGGRIHLGNGGTAESLLARGGRVVAVGRADDLAHDAAAAERIDLRDGLMVPGWIDAHCHFVMWAHQRSWIDVSDTSRVDEALARIERYLAGAPKDRWLLGGSFDHNRWGRWPTATELDRVTGHHPASLRSKDGHSRWLNSRALALAGIQRGAEAPSGGYIGLDEHGAPTGILKENARSLIDRIVPQPDADERYAALRAGQADALRKGITGIVTLDNFAGGIPLDAFERLRRRGELVLRSAIGLPHTRLDEAIALGLRTGFGDEWLQIGPVKVYADGALGSQSAALEEPYEGSDDRGIVTVEPEQLARDVARAADAGLSIAVHAIGDRAVRIALDAFGAAGHRPALRQRIEHVQLVRVEDVARFAGVGVIASMQPIHATSDRDVADRHWGPHRTGRAYPWRTLARAGAVLAFGSDAPIEPIDPLLGIHAAVTRRRLADRDSWHPELALDLDAALAAYAAGSAYAMGRERDLGTLAPGKWCDATVIEGDLATVEPASWPSLRVTATITAGVIRHADGIS